MKKHHRLPATTFFAHRGLWNDTVPENSLMAFQRAMERGYGIECDVRVSAEGVPVVFHDRSLQRMTGDPRDIERCVVGYFSHYTLLQSSERIPTLRDVLSLVDGAVPIYIEIKSDSFFYKEKLKAIMRVLETYDGVFFIASFDARIVADAVEKYHVQAMQIFSTRSLVKRLWSFVLWYLYGHRGTAISVPQHIVEKPFFIARRRRYALFAWTVKKDAEADRIAPFADGIVFEGFLPPRTTKTQR